MQFGIFMPDFTPKLIIFQVYQDHISSTTGWLCFLFLCFLKNIYLFIYLVAPALSYSRWTPQLRQVGSLVADCRLLSCGMRTLSCSMHVGSSSLTRDRTQAPCIGSVESYPLCHQRSPWLVVECLLYVRHHLIFCTIFWKNPSLR